MPVQENIKVSSLQYLCATLQPLCSPVQPRPVPGSRAQINIGLDAPQPLLPANVVQRDSCWGPYWPTGDQDRTIGLRLSVQWCSWFLSACEELCRLKFFFSDAVTSVVNLHPLEGTLLPSCLFASYYLLPSLPMGIPIPGAIWPNVRCWTLWDHPQTRDFFFD